ncbi:efflux transporter outer membrane subunit [Legionella birminghamensis]|nr:efflux transporter outer membrane subunit [Legionella birminghamensis]
MFKFCCIPLCLLLNSCMVGPNYKEPPKPVAGHWIENSPAVKAAPSQTANWWNVFNDPVLTQLIHRGYQNNLSLQIAGVRVLQARAQLAQSVGELYPQQQAMVGDYTYYRIGGSELQTVLPSSFETASLGFTASWELDFWGKYRRAIQSNDAVFLASLAAYDNALVTLTADIADTYVNIRTIERQVAVTKANIQLQSTSLKIAKARYRGGQTSLLDVQQAETQLTETQASLPKLLSELQHQKDILGLFMGTVPTQVNPLISKSRGIPRAPSQVSVGIPREVIVRRPDIYQSRMEAIAQSEAIGAIKANLFPALTLKGNFVFSSNSIGSNSISDLFNWSNRSITAGPSLTWPLLNYGQITNAVRVQDAAFQQALLKYVNLVLQAQQEVQDNITRYIESRKSVYFLQQSDKSARMSTKLALVRYKEGEAIYTTVLDAERQQLRVETSLTNAQGEVAKSLIALYRSLGGGWQIRGCNDILPNYIKQQMAERTDWGNLLKQKNHQMPNTQLDVLKQLYLPNW